MANTISDVNEADLVKELNSNIKKISKEFVDLEKKLEDLKWVCNKRKNEVRDEYVTIEHSLSKELRWLQLSKLGVGNDEFEVSKLKLNNNFQVFQKASEKLELIKNKSEALKEDIIEEVEDLRKPTNVKLSKQKNPINPVVLKCRQTDEPFVLKMLNEKSFKCNGCNIVIPLKSHFLKHYEEYPVNSKRVIPHSYHLNRECLLLRGFEDNYLREIPVKVIPSMKGLNNELEEMGFKNIYVCGRDASVNSDDTIPDNISEASSHASRQNFKSRNKLPKKPMIQFYYCMMPNNQKRKINCDGCQLDISDKMYLELAKSQIDASKFGACSLNNDKFTFHVNKPCLIKADVLPDDLSTMVCHVNKFLKTHEDLVNVISCGFYYHNIRGFKPQNPEKPNFKNNKPNNNKGGQNNRPSGNKIGFIAEPTANAGDSKFIFNTEPFSYFTLKYSEKCQGCIKSITKGEGALCHKERVPRPQKDKPPLISQFYHCNKKCLELRGFTHEYIKEFIKCDVKLTGSDNLEQILKYLKGCGFNSIDYQYVGKETTNNNFYILLCETPNIRCTGCKSGIQYNKPCLLYSHEPIFGKLNELKVFHIRVDCLHTIFTASDLREISCIHDMIVDIDPNEVIKCGFANIDTQTITKPQNLKSEASKPRMTPHNNNNNNNNRILEFEVNLLRQHNRKCAGCGHQLEIDKYVLQLIKSAPSSFEFNGNKQYQYLHLNRGCLNLINCTNQQITSSKLSFLVQTSQQALSDLRHCGFRHLPQIPLSNS